MKNNFELEEQTLREQGIAISNSLDFWENQLLKFFEKLNNHKGFLNEKLGQKYGLELKHLLEKGEFEKRNMEQFELKIIDFLERSSQHHIANLFPPPPDVCKKKKK